MGTFPGGFFNGLGSFYIRANFWIFFDTARWNVMITPGYFHIFPFSKISVSFELVLFARVPFITFRERVYVKIPGCDPAVSSYTVNQNEKKTSRTSQTIIFLRSVSLILYHNWFNTEMFIHWICESVLGSCCFLYVVVSFHFLRGTMIWLLLDLLVDLYLI